MDEGFTYGTERVSDIRKLTGNIPMGDAAGMQLPIRIQQTQSLMY